MRRLLLALALVTLAPGAALAQTSERAALDEVEAQHTLATALYVTAGVLVGGGIVALVVGGVASIDCGPGGDCGPAEIAIGVGAAAAGAGLITLVIATFVEQGANDRRRQILRERLSLSIVSERGGGGLALTWRW